MGVKLSRLNIKIGSKLENAPLAVVINISDISALLMVVSIATDRDSGRTRTVRYH